MVFNCRTERISVFKIGLFSNHMVLVGIGVELALLAFLIYTPFMHNLFNTAPLGLSNWAFLLILPILVFSLEELRKAVLRGNDRRKQKRQQIPKKEV